MATSLEGFWPLSLKQGATRGTLIVTQKHLKTPLNYSPFTLLRKLEKAVAVRNSLLEKFSGKFRRCWKILHRFSGSAKCYPCQGLGIFRQGKRLLENRLRLRERCWIFSSETATASLSSSDLHPCDSLECQEFSSSLKSQRFCTTWPPPQWWQQQAEQPQGKQLCTYVEAEGSSSKNQERSTMGAMRRAVSSLRLGPRLFEAICRI